MEDKLINLENNKSKNLYNVLLNKNEETDLFFGIEFFRFLTGLFQETNFKIKPKKS